MAEDKTKSNPWRLVAISLSLILATTLPMATYIFKDAVRDASAGIIEIKLKQEQTESDVRELRDKKLGTEQYYRDKKEIREDMNDIKKSVDSMTGQMEKLYNYLIQHNNGTARTP